MQTETKIATGLVELSRKKFMHEFWPRVCTCLDSLTEEQIWWRPNANSNGIGNLLLHLNGNLRQWIVASVGQQPDRRDRDAEFSERGGLKKDDLQRNLDRTLAEVDSILEGIKPEDLLKTYTIQKYENVTALEAIFHVTEHFAMHYGQILYMTKLLRDTDLGFFKHLEKKKPQETPASLIRMQKTLIENRKEKELESGGEWLNLVESARIELTSESPSDPAEGALSGKGSEGWKAAAPGQQTLRLVFHRPQRIRRIHLEFSEPERERSQEFSLKFSREGGAGEHEIVRQRWNFSPQGATREIEDYAVELDDVRVLELTIDPDLGRNRSVATLRRWLMA